MFKRHVLFMVTDFAPLTSIGRIRTQKMCKFLPEAGWRSSVLTIDPPPGTLTDADLLAEVPPETVVHRVGCPQPIEAPVRLASRLVHALGISHYPSDRMNQIAPSPRPADPSWFEHVSTLVDRVKREVTRRCMIPDNTVTAIPGLVRAAVDLIRRERVDVLVASVPGFSPWLAAVLVGRRTGVPVVVDYRDLWHRDVLRNWIGPVRRRFELALERWALTGTQAVVTASGGKTRTVRQLDDAPDRRSYTTIYNGFDQDDLRGVEPHRLDRDVGRLVLLHAGKLYGNRRIDPLLESVGRLVSAGRLRRECLRVRLLGVIETQQRRRIDQIVRRHRLEEVVEVGGYVTRADALAQQLAADAAILIVDPGETSDGVVPGKLTEYIGLRRFVLAVCPPGEARTMLARYGHAAWASADEPDQLDAALTGLFKRWQGTGAIDAGPSAGDAVPTRRQNAERMAAVLGSVVNCRKAGSDRATRHVLLVEMGTGVGGATKCLLSMVGMCVAQGWRTSVALAYPLAELERAESSCTVIPLYEDRAFRRGQRIRRVADGEVEPRGRIAATASFLTAVLAADLPVARRLAKYARRHGVDLVHANNELLANRVAILAGRLAGLPVISHQRGWSCRSWANRVLAGWADRMVAVSDAVADDLVAAGVARAKVCRVYDGIDADGFADAASRRESARRSLGLDPQDEVVGLPAVLLPWKGHEMFLRAFARVARQRPHAKALLVGASPANVRDLRPVLERRIAELGLTSQVRITGHVDQMADVYAALDLAAHTSLAPEPFGLVVIEAMAAGTAILAADTGGPAEIIRHGVDGWLYPMGDADALAAGIIRLLEERPLRERLARRGAASASRFDPAVTRREMLAVYDQALRPAVPSLAGGWHALAPPNPLAGRFC